ncbi:MAG: SUMF1/EgtB/PvdO family nonheme iron enzyme [bacterium]
MGTQNDVPRLRLFLTLLGLLMAVSSVQCEKTTSAPDEDAALDASSSEAGIDANLWDGGEDAALPDASLLDAQVNDAASPDASLVDASITDAEVGDASVTDGGGPPACPPEMVLINSTYCIDIWEASRPDATGLSPGIDESYAVSAPDVLPWWSSILTAAQAELACNNASKRLCTAAEWEAACAGPTQTIYGYGDIYEPTTCNGIDARCDCTNAACSSQPVCPFAHCWSQCGGAFHVDPTGFYSGCVNGWGLYDMNGNVWEAVDATDLYPFRGGAFNCGNSETNHRCDFTPWWNISAKGFRCCADPQ